MSKEFKHLKELDKKRKYKSRTEMTHEEFIGVLPSKLQKRIDPNDIEYVKEIEKENDFKDFEITENVVRFADVLNDNNYSSKSFIEAIIYVTLLSSGLSRIEAYKRTFPNKVYREDGTPVPEGTLHAKAKVFHHKKIVQKVIQLVKTPVDIMFWQEGMEAMETLHRIMTESKNERNKIEAAKVILEHTNKVELDEQVQQETTSMVNKMVEALRDTAKAQLEMIKSGANVTKVINIKPKVSDE